MSDPLFYAITQAKWLGDFAKSAYLKTDLKRVEVQIERLIAELTRKNIHTNKLRFNFTMKTPNTPTLQIKLLEPWGSPIRVESQDDFFELVNPTTIAVHPYSATFVELHGYKQIETAFITVRVDLEYKLEQSDIDTLVRLGKLKISTESFVSAAVSCTV